LSPALLERAAGEIVRRHEILRTTFALHEGVPVQIVAPAAPEGTLFSCPVVNIDEIDPDLPLEAREEEALRRGATAARESFDLGEGPLLRITLYRLSASAHLLLLTMHHIVTDGWSFGL